MDACIVGGNITEVVLTYRKIMVNRIRVALAQV